MSAVPKPVVVKNPKHLAFIRTLPCWFAHWGNCDRTSTIGNGQSEASHLDGKSRDDRALPKCGGHHRTNTVSWHNGEVTFCEVYGVTKEELIAEAEALYAQHQ